MCAVDERQRHNTIQSSQLLRDCYMTEPRRSYMARYVGPRREAVMTIRDRRHIDEICCFIAVFMTVHVILLTSLVRNHIRVLAATCQKNMISLYAYFIYARTRVQRQPMRIVQPNSARDFTLPYAYIKAVQATYYTVAHLPSYRFRQSSFSGSIGISLCT